MASAGVDTMIRVEALKASQGLRRIPERSGEDEMKQRQKRLGRFESRDRRSLEDHAGV